MQTNDIFILAYNDFIHKEETKIKTAKIMTKNQKYLTSTQFLKFNGAYIKLNLDDIILIKKNHVNKIFLVIDYNIDSTSLRRITRTKLFS